jgi:prevent-host-death family protein
MNRSSSTVGSYEAKFQLATLLDRVEQGEEITITRHGLPVAHIVPIRPTSASGERRDSIGADARSHHQKSVLAS